MGGGVTGSTTVFGAVSTGPSPVPPAMASVSKVAPLAIVLAAGKGTRMGSDLPKVLHLLANRTLLEWALEAVVGVEPARIMVVVGHGAEQVIASLPAGVESCVQEEQLGTGHAVMVGMEALGEVDPNTPIMVTAGDMPFVAPSLLRRLVVEKAATSAVLAMVTASVENTRGFGRVVRNRDGLVEAIVEEGDADAETLAIREVNAGIYVFSAGKLLADLARLGSDNAQGEYYLTDVVAMTVDRGEAVHPVLTSEEVVIGINTLEQLSEAEALIRAGRIGALG